ncbi:FG-GAP repeat protein [Ectopseudomonas oleovorans]|uniref:FG-GAP repeat protein n=1 Tax=Ectopseudomonas oleovorans TaxID=301 RepID=A0AA42QDC9_ECTOL|nr:MULTISPECIES: FG-GAP repeat protein [Pseudomonas]MCR1825695.1 FG-GAP repeat protein [Pseudomonas oleovorans]MDH0565697.1 FG-GAP repeat protein [Pseudomonas oleovorans]MDH1341660.1 FG-GAP repeat protein [Pseudomonas oleovorans]MDH1491397.1 FG-GAP repeat protein [Pseudomonas oleovorans]WGG19411.1 FG-GAP repeat protein [Pseudomonas oleovorans]
MELSIPEGNDAEPPSFAVEDYDFDDHPDLAIRVPAGMVNSAHHVYLYRPALRRFEQLQIPPALMERVNCAWLSELQPNNDENRLRPSGAAFRSTHRKPGVTARRIPHRTDRSSP